MVASRAGHATPRGLTTLMVKEGRCHGVEGSMSRRKYEYGLTEAWDGRGSSESLAYKKTAKDMCRDILHICFFIQKPKIRKESMQLSLTMKYLVSLGALVSAVSAQAPLYGQCGGQGWTGATTCVSGSVCTATNQWYSQCLPGTAAPSVTTTLVTKTTSTAKSTATATSPPANSLGWKWFGVNEAGGEFGEKTLPGTWGKDFIFPDTSTITVGS